MLLGLKCRDCGITNIIVIKALDLDWLCGISGWIVMHLTIYSAVSKYLDNGTIYVLLGLCSSTMDLK